MTRLTLTSVIASKRGRALALCAALAVTPLLPAAETIAPVRTEGDLQLPVLLEHVGQQVEKFWTYFSSVTCTEEMTQSKIGEKGKVLFEQRESFDYLIILQASGTDLAVDESRVEKTHKVSKGKASLLETNGFSILTLIFHPLYQSRYEFRRLPDDSASGRPLIRVAFEQVVSDHPLSVLLLREREYPLLWRGTAFIDPANFEVVRIQAGLGTSLAETGLLRLDADVSYSDVRFNQTAHFWLPSRAVIEAETRRQHWRNTHLFSNYRRFEVETQVKTADPQ